MSQNGRQSLQKAIGASYSVLGALAFLDLADIGWIDIGEMKIFG